MAQEKEKSKEYYEIDIMHILRTLWYKIWVIVLVTVLTASAGFAYSAFAIKPDYSSSILLYVNNRSGNSGNPNYNISNSDITASQSLVKTYTEILKNRTTLERVIDKADVNYSYSSLNAMIKAGSSNNTEIMKVTVTCKDPYEAAKIANAIAEVLPVRISEIIDGASMEVVESAIANLRKVGPNITTYTLVAMLLGAGISALAIAISALMDDTIHSEEYITQNYDYPILARVPNLLETKQKSYSYYNYYKKSGSGEKSGSDTKK